MELILAERSMIWSGLAGRRGGGLQHGVTYLAVRAGVDDAGVVEDIFPELCIAGCGISMDLVVCLL
jgi:hypothetical protein